MLQYVPRGNPEAQVAQLFQNITSNSKGLAIGPAFLTGLYASLGLGRAQENERLNEIDRTTLARIAEASERAAQVQQRSAELQLSEAERVVSLRAKRIEYDNQALRLLSQDAVRQGKRLEFTREEFLNTRNRLIAGSGDPDAGELFNSTSSTLFDTRLDQFEANTNLNNATARAIAAGANGFVRREGETNAEAILRYQQENGFNGTNTQTQRRTQDTSVDPDLTTPGFSGDPAIFERPTSFNSGFGPNNITTQNASIRERVGAGQTQQVVGILAGRDQLPNITDPNQTPGNSAALQNLSRILGTDLVPRNTGSVRLFNTIERLQARESERARIV